MTKVKNSFIIFLICILSSCVVVQASDDGFIQINSETELEACLTKETGCRLANDLTLTSSKGITGNVFLDLNGHSLTASSNLKLHSGLIYVNRGSKLTVEDKTGAGKITTGKNSEAWGGIQLIKQGDNASDALAELIVNGGTIEGYYYGIVGNGNQNNTKLTINAGTIRGLNDDDSVGIYQPQKGDTIINNGNISGGTGIEIRAGNLTINNGTIKATSPKFTRVANSSGTTTNGAGITIAQHTTKQAINVTINNGNISGQYALYEWNPNKNSKNDLNKINIQVKGGAFNSTIEDGYAVYSEDFKKFISGGKFNTEVNEYLTDDAKLSNKVTYDNKVKLNINKSSNNLTFIFILAFLVLSILGLIIYYKKKNSITLFKKN